LHFKAHFVSGGFLGYVIYVQVVALEPLDFLFSQLLEFRIEFLIGCGLSGGPRERVAVPRLHPQIAENVLRVLERRFVAGWRDPEGATCNLRPLERARASLGRRKLSVRDRRSPDLTAGDQGAAEGPGRGRSRKLRVRGLSRGELTVGILKNVLLGRELGVLVREDRLWLRPCQKGGGSEDGPGGGRLLWPREDGFALVLLVGEGGASCEDRSVRGGREDGLLGPREDALVGRGGAEDRLLRLRRESGGRRGRAERCLVVVERAGRGSVVDGFQHVDGVRRGVFATL
jgi:hypothetical protein